MPALIDPSLASSPTDNEMKTLQKINQLFTFMAINPDPALASVSSDRGLSSMHKLNQLLYNQAVTLTSWTNCSITQGSSSAGQPVQWRYESYGIIRLRGIAILTDSTGKSKIPGLPPIYTTQGQPIGFFAQSGYLADGVTPCIWSLQFQAGSLSFVIVTPTGSTGGGTCGLNGVTYTYQ